MKVLILTTVMAPYRIKLFNELGKYCKLKVCFEQNRDNCRNDNWYTRQEKNFELITLKKWDKSLKYPKIEIIKYIDKMEVDIAIAYEYSTITAMILMFVCKIKKIPYIINCDGAFINKNLVKDLIKTFYISNATKCLGSGDCAKKYFLNYNAKEKDVFIHKFTSLLSEDILNRVILKEEKKLLKKELNIQDKPTAIAVGQFTHRKGFDVLIKAWKKLNKDYNLIIIGGGELYEEYKQEIKKEKLNNIFLVDFIESEKLYEYYKACEVFVLPTREDIWGLVINEAMSCGLPIITTDKCVAGLEMIEEQTNGYIVPIDNENELINRINEILGNPSLQEIMAKNNLEKIREYTIENLAQSHLKVLREIG